METLLDTIGLILWGTVFLSPLIAIPIAWKMLPVKKLFRVLFGFIGAAVLSVLCYSAALTIIFRDGIGPM